MKLILISLFVLCSFGCQEKKSTEERKDTISNIVLDELPVYSNEDSLNAVTKIGITTDQHYDPQEPYVGRNKTLYRLNNFKNRMYDYQPDFILEGGDKVGAVTKGNQRLINSKKVTEFHREIAKEVGADHFLWGWGNHDFENGVTFKEFLNEYNNLPGQVENNLYAAWEDSNFRYISLDANYFPGSNKHMSDSHQGFGYINPDQLIWLQKVLGESQKPSIVFSHQLLQEADTKKLGLPKEIYHVQNRTAVREILEKSGKVAFVITGHTHMTSFNIINGIPYLNITDINELPERNGFWDTPNSYFSGDFQGRWGIIEINRQSETARLIQETQINDSVETIYSFTVPYNTIFSSSQSDDSNSPYNAAFEKPLLVQDATDLYINDEKKVVVKPASLYDNDPRKSQNTLKVIGRTNPPDYGILQWPLDSVPDKFRLSFSIRFPEPSENSFSFQGSGPGSKISLAFLETGLVKFISGDTVQNLGDYNTNEWYEFKMYFNFSSKNLDIKINEELVASNLKFDSNLKLLSGVEIFTTQGILYIDSLQIKPSP